jgi:hypothetical protein
VGRTGRVILGFLAAASAVVASTARADVSEAFPASRPANRLQALAALGGGVHAPDQCLTLRIQAAVSATGGVAAASRRALAILRQDAPLPGEQRRADGSGDVIRYTLDRASVDRLEPSTSSEAAPPAVLVAIEALDEARSLLVGSLDLPDPGPLDVLLVHLGPGSHGAFLPPGGDDRRGTIWIDGAGSAGRDEIRADVAHQFAHAVAARIGLDAAWGEALAGWTALRLGGAGASRTEAAISARFGRLGDGIPTEDARLALGNASWLAWLHESKGATAMRVALVELAASPDFPAATERALRRVDGSGWKDALRDFHLWSVLVGSWDDGRHFPFASRLDDPRFAAESEGLPALSIQASAPIAGGGVAHARVRPDRADGGVTVRFEGEFGGLWECDLLLRGAGGELRRLAVPLDADGRGQVTVPAGTARDLVLLVRNVDDPAGPARRYTWTAFRDAEYPVRFLSVEAAAVDEPHGAISVRWETVSERGLVGFHVLRSAADGEFRIVHPIWVPAVGTATEGALYEFVDTDASPGLAYRYRVDAITEDGLTSRSVTVSASPAPEPSH